VATGCGARLNAREISAASGPPPTVASKTGSTPGAAGPSAGEQETTSTTAAGGGGGAGPQATAQKGSTSGVQGGATTASTGVANPGVANPNEDNGGATDVGVTATDITIGNVSTLTGPVPGLFRGAQLGTQAFVEYQNSLGGVHGRRLKLAVADDRLDSGQNRAQHQALVGKVFAFVGSFSVNDDGGVSVLQSTGAPDIGVPLSFTRKALPNNISPNPLPPGASSGPFNWYKKANADAIGHVAGFYGNVQSARDGYRGIKHAAESVGFKFDYERELQATEANYTADVIQMKNKGIKTLMMTIDVGNMARMAKAIQQQNFKLDLPIYGGNAYDPKFLSLAGTAAEGAMIYSTTALYAGEDRATVPEVDLFLKWLAKVAPGATPDLFTVYGWISGRLFVQALTAAGPQAKRATLLDALRKIDAFDSNGLIAPVGPGTKRPATCFLMMKVQGGKFVRTEPAGKGFSCENTAFVPLS
jgi:ABC-type branched-subunit amino acid transport system substrate-binding protein